MIGAIDLGSGKRWMLASVPFYSNGKIGSLVCDSGAALTCINLSFARTAGLHIRGLDAAASRTAVTPTGARLMPIGLTDVTLEVQLVLLDETATWLHWNRRFTLTDVVVYDFGADSPRDIYVGYADWAFEKGAPSTALGHLAHLVMNGAKLLAAPRMPPAGTKVPLLEVTNITTRNSERSPNVDSEAESTRVLTAKSEKHADRVRGSPGLCALNMTRAQSPPKPVARQYTWQRQTAAASLIVVAAMCAVDAEKANAVPKPDEFNETATGAAVAPVGLRERIGARIDESMRDTSEAAQLTEILMQRARVFGDINPTECTETIEFKLVAEPKEVGFMVPASKRAGLDVYAEVLGRWINAGYAERVPWEEKAYGFAIVLPKAGGKWRVTINPTGLNAATERFQPEGGFMPTNMIDAAIAAGRRRYAVTLDLREAFLTMKLGPLASELSTFTTPIGKIRWKHAYFGWHSFPAKFQQLIQQRVVLPTLDEFGDGISVLAWIDDVVLTADNLSVLLEATRSVVDRILAFGGRIGLEKCHFLVSTFQWCGVQVDLATSQWRVDPARTSALTETPVP